MSALHLLSGTECLGFSLIKGLIVCEVLIGVDWKYSRGTSVYTWYFGMSPLFDDCDWILVLNQFTTD